MRTYSLLRVTLPLVTLAALAAASAPQAGGAAFRVHLTDPIESEPTASADLNNDGRPDIISAESWYEAPSWTKHPLRAINRASGYVDDFSDLPVDVDGDGYIDIVQVGYFA